ncbi:MAG TPA: peptidylprolyl isomerase [Lysobacter sp.]|nr:peptidylprolyl isomerase [Lysobacter sp.]
MKTFLASLLATLLLFAAAVPAQQTQPIDRIVAVVNEDVVLRSELDRAVANILGQYAGRENQLPPREVLERQVLERLVLLKLQVARAQETGVRVTDPEVDQAIAGIAAQNNVSLDQLREQLAQEGTPFTEFRNSVREEMLIQRLRQRFAQSRISVSDAEVDAALQQQQAGGAQYRLAHILVALPENPTPEQVATGQQKIEGIKALLERGEMDFAAAAVRYSDSPNALEGGDLGWRSLDEIPPAFANLVRSLSVGQVVGPIRGPSGFQLLRLVETRDASQAAPQLVTQYQARHILIRVDDDTTDAQARARAETLRARIAGGADFAQLARENSEDLGSKARGGDIGWFTRDEYGLEFGGAVAGLQDGEVSAPVRTQAGWHLIQRVGTREADIGAQNRREQVREMIGRRKLEDEWNRFLREIRGDAYVENRLTQQAADAEPAAAGG